MDYWYVWYIMYVYIYFFQIIIESHKTGSSVGSVWGGRWREEAVSYHISPLWQPAHDSKTRATAGMLTMLAPCVGQDDTLVF